MSEVAGLGPLTGAAAYAWVAWAGLLGLAVGSFVNVVAHRVPAGVSVVSPPSACPACGAGIRARHNVPVLGWLVLRGRCHDCAAPISARYPVVETLTGVLFAVVAWRFLADWPLLPAYLWFTAVGLALALVDLDVRRLPDALLLPSYPVLAALLALEGDGTALARSGLGALAVVALFVTVRLAAPGAMGLGDVKLAGLVGGVTAYLSWGTALVGTFAGFALGAACGLLLVAAGRAGRRSTLPFGPFMVLGAWAAVVGAGGWGDAYLVRVAG